MIEILNVLFIIRGFNNANYFTGILDLIVL